MSVTFGITRTLDDIVGVGLVCYANTHTHEGVFATYDDAAEALQARRAAGNSNVCCSTTTRYAPEATDEFDVNVSNRNAWAVLTAMVLLNPASDDGDLWGETTPEDLRGRIELTQWVGPTDYFVDWAERMIPLLDAAEAAGRTISWS